MLNGIKVWLNQYFGSHETMTQTTKGDFYLQVNPMGTSVTGGPFTLDIAAAGGGALTLTPASGDLPEGQEGVAYDSGVSEISGGVPPYTLSNETDVPSGLALAILSDGITVQLSGTPVVGDAAESPFNIGFTVTD